MTMTITKRAFVYLLVMAFISPMITTVGGVWWTAQAINHNNHKLCNILANSDRPLPPNWIADPEIKKRAQDSLRYTHQLRIDYGCIKK